MTILQLTSAHYGCILSLYVNKFTLDREESQDFETLMRVDELHLKNYTFFAEANNLQFVMFMLSFYVFFPKPPHVLLNLKNNVCLHDCPIVLQTEGDDVIECRNNSCHLQNCFLLRGSTL